MKFNIFVFLALFISCLAIPNASAQTEDGVPLMKVCETPLPVNAGAAIGAGFINFCVFYPAIVQPGSTFFIKSTLTAPATVVPVFTTAANAFQGFTGCTEGTPAVFTPTTNGVYGTMWSAISTLTMTSEQCDGVATALLTIAAVPLQVYSSNLPINIQTENVRVDNFNYLCDAPEIAPNAYSVTATTCNDPNFGEISCIGCNDTVTIGNTNVTVNVNATGNMTGGNATAGPPGFDGSLYVLLTVIGLAFAHMGETRRSNGPRIIGGGFLFAASLAIFHELERLGFTNMDNKTTDMALLIMAIHWLASVYLFFPKDYEDTDNE